MCIGLSSVKLSDNTSCDSNFIVFGRVLYRLGFDCVAQGAGRFVGVIYCREDFFRVYLIFTGVLFL